MTNSNNYQTFWLKKSNLIVWHKKPSKSVKLLKNNKHKWFPDGKLNAAFNCLGKNIKLYENKKAIVFVNEKKELDDITYGELENLVNKFCIFLISKKKKINKVLIHASSSIVSVVSMLASAKMGVEFTVVFEDLPLNAIEQRINLFKPDIIITRSKFYTIDNFNNLKKEKDFFIITSNDKQKLSSNSSYFKFKKVKKKIIIPYKYFNSNNPFFTLFTSGSTGVPKAIVHSTGGFLLYAKYTAIKQFNMNSKSTVLTASDAGWINGHNYGLFAPLSLGATVICLEKPFLLIDYKFLNKLIKKLEITILYLPVTLIRLMKSIYPQNKKIYNSSIKVLGSMGEPLASSVAKWFSDLFFKDSRPIVNTYYQTETGAILASPRYNEKKVKTNGTVGKPLNKYIRFNIPKNKKKLFNLEIKLPWPGQMINILNGVREWNKYWNKKNFRLFDLAKIDKNNNINVTGRSDDVINIRGHRIGSEEIESTLLKLKEIKETSAISIDDNFEGSGFIIFYVSKLKLEKKINRMIEDNYGSFALPKKIFKITELPKTKSGKILRRLLRTIYDDPKSINSIDLSTMINKKVIYELKKILK